ncbi:MAG TPA: response regulator [Bacteroidales bacterium]|nr:response regulator [Bacteroidales bacterium]
MAKTLLVDDESTHNFLNTTLLNLIGETDVEARISGLEALQFLEECNANNTFPDIIFLDLNLAGMNGFEFLEHFEKKFNQKKSSVIVLTNSILESDKEEAFKYKSVLDFWSKPLTRDKLTDLFQRIEVEK